METDILMGIGLNAEEAKMYASLLEHGSQSAARLASTTGIKRTYIYYVASSLAKRGLISQEKKYNTTIFAPLSPDMLLSLAAAQKERATASERALEGLLPSLKLKYTTLEEKPLVTTYEGLDGLKKLYKNIVAENTDIMLFRSYYDDKKPEIDQVVNTQIALQVEHNIHARVVGPYEEGSKETYLKFDQSRLVTRRFIKTLPFVLPSQIILYGTSKVALVSLKQSIVTTLIDNIDIYTTFKAIFEYIWNISEAEHTNLVKEWAQEKPL
jgi:sugar-specific transcriptional regulator TrmB